MAEDDIINLRYPSPDMTPTEFEELVARILRLEGRNIEGLEVKLHEVLEAPDGSYDIDATARFQALGVDFLVLAEAKMHTNPIKRELVQVLSQKVLSAGAHKGILVSAAPFQRGAISFAAAHGIALIQVVEGRHTVVQKAAKAPDVSREVARRMGVPDYVGLVLSPGTTPTSVHVTTRHFDETDRGIGTILGIPGAIEH